jgi:branched-chain amino acid transport system permease protein
MKPDLRARWIIRIVLLAALLAAPFALSTFRLGLLAEILIFGLAAVSLNLLVGVTGLPSLGHAAFFGLGGYAAGLTSVHLTQSAWLGLLLAIGVGLVFALPAGWLAVRTDGITFLMLSLAFAEILHSVSQTWRPVTGGADGLTGIGNVELWPGFAINSVPLRYYYVLIIVAVCYVAVRRFADSPVGWTLRGIKSNPERMSSLGYNVRRYRLAAYVVAGVVGSVAGALNVQYARFVSPDNMGFMISAFLLVMVLLGGAKRLHGALIGAAILILARHELSSRFDSWELGLGLILVLVIYFMPKGVAGLADVFVKGKRPLPLGDDTKAKEKVDA